MYNLIKNQQEVKLQTQTFTNLKDNVKSTISDVETLVNSLGHQIKFTKNEALNNFRETKEEFITVTLSLRDEVEKIDSYTTQRKDQVVGELIKLRGLLDREVTHKVDEFENYKQEIFDSIDNVNKSLEGEVDERVRDDFKSFKFVASDLKLRLNTLKLFFIDEKRKNILVESLEDKRVEVKTNLDALKQKLADMKEEAKNDLFAIENGVKEDYKRLESFVNKLSI